jgi:hypothetical protein
VATDPINGCNTSASTLVEENTVAPGGLSITNPGRITCNNPSINISGFTSIANATYDWMGPNGHIASTKNITVNQGGDYKFTVTNTANGCSASLTTTVIDNAKPPVVTIVNTSPLSCSNLTVTLTAVTSAQSVSYLWLGPDGFADNAASTITNIPGEYSVIVSNATTGCSTTGITQVTGDLSECGRKATGSGNTTTTVQNPAIPGEAVTQFAYKAYPNPVTSNSLIEFASPENTVVTVGLYNSLGVCEKVLFKGNATAQQRYKLAVPATQLPAGAYYYIINTGGKTYTGKLVIVK